jgi:hypothetical protein
VGELPSVAGLGGRVTKIDLDNVVSRLFRRPELKAHRANVGEERGCCDAALDISRRKATNAAPRRPDSSLEDVGSPVLWESSNLMVHGSS